MASVNVRDLRNHGGDVLDRVLAGETLTVLRSGDPVAQLVPIPRPGPSPAELVRRRRNLPPVDLDSLRRDAGAAVDAAL